MTDLQLTDVYVQVDVIRGYRYLDRAGEVMNLYDHLFDEMEVSVEGLHMASTNREARGLKEMRLSSKRYWLRFDSPDTFTLALDQARDYIGTISEIFGVNTARRIGARSNWLMPVESAERATEIAVRLGASQPFKDVHSYPVGGEFSIRWNVGNDVVMNCRIVAAERAKRAPERIPAFSVAVDLDAYEESSDGVPLSRFSGFLRRAERAVYTTRQNVESLLEEAN